MEFGRLGLATSDLLNRHNPALKHSEVPTESTRLVRCHTQLSYYVTNSLMSVGYGYASDYKKSVHAKRFLNSWYVRGYGPGYGMLFRVFSAIRSYSPLFSDQNVSSISYSRYSLYSVAYPYV